MKEGSFRLNMRKRMFAVRVVRHGERMPREVVHVPSLNVSTVRFYGALSNLIY